MRLLVVEDGLTQAAKLRRDLETAGFEVEVARDGQKGLEAFAAARFDVVLTDVVMPGLSGYDLCRRIKTSAGGHHTPVILVTALHEPRDIIQGLECGADNFISKPYEGPHLIARINALLARASAQQEPAHEDGLAISFMGRPFTITAGKEQILTFLASTFEDFVHAQRREQDSRLAQQRQRLEAEAARNREELLRREKETLDGMVHNLVAMQQELSQVNGELDRKVAELTQANLALREMNRLKGDFLATMSHELRTPLNAIIGFSEVLADDGQLSTQHRRYAANIQSSGKMLLAMINDILDAAKIESGKMEVRVEEFSVRSLCEPLATAMQPIASRRGIDLVCRLDEAIPPLRQDLGKSRQIVNNLLSNAIKFTPSGGRVTLWTGVEGTDLVVAVTDTGIGVAESDRETIFERFRQVLPPEGEDGVLVREHRGTGLGLSIARDLARLLGGDIALESTLGRGSTFTLRLPQRLPCCKMRTISPYSSLATQSALAPAAASQRIRAAASSAKR
jgi:signal transduction histidine kinase